MGKEMRLGDRGMEEMGRNAVGLRGSTGTGRAKAWLGPIGVNGLEI